MSMSLCDQCREQEKKLRSGKPHDRLVKFGEARLFKGRAPRSFEEQDYECVSCRARFTQSTDRNGLAWTLWRG